MALAGALSGTANTRGFAMAQDTSLLALVALADYREQRQHLFPSTGSLTWYVRQHRAALIEAGALSLHAGRWLAVPDSFDSYVIAAGRRAARARTVPA